MVFKSLILKDFVSSFIRKNFYTSQFFVELGLVLKNLRTIRVHHSSLNPQESAQNS